MLKSCTYCGQIHEKNFDCGKKPTATKKNTDLDKFRSSFVWQKKRNYIKKRDKYICQICAEGVFDVGSRKYNTEELEVHHIEPLKNDFSLRLNNENLLTLCRKHHEMAECGKIPKDVLKRIALTREHPPGRERKKQKNFQH